MGGSLLTGVSDVESPAGRGVVGLEFQADYVSTAGQLRGHLMAWEGAQDGYIRNPIIFDREEIKLGLHVKIIKDEVNSASWFGDDQPDTVHVVAVFLGIIGWENNSRWCSKVEETRNCEDTHFQTILHMAK